MLGARGLAPEGADSEEERFRELLEQVPGEAFARFET